MTENLNELDSMIAFLKRVDIYEEQMTVNEISEIIKAIKESMGISEDLTDDPWINDRDGFLSSTVIDTHRQTRSRKRRIQRSSPISSPEVDTSQEIIVVAEVHHEQDWSPKKSGSVMKRKRLAENNETLTATSAKRALLCNDSGCSSDINASDSCHTDSNAAKC